MKSKFVAALLSGLMFPGAGQYYLGRRQRGLLFIVLAAAGGLLWLSFALDQATALADGILGGSIGLDPAAIAARIDAQPTPLPEKAGALLFLAGWVGSVLEALLVQPSVK